MRRLVLPAAGLIGLTLIASAGIVRSSDAPRRSVRLACDGGVLSVVATGDIMMGSDPEPLAEAQRAAGDSLRQAHVVLGDLATTLSPDGPRDLMRGPSGGLEHARILRRWGFTVLSRANDHAGDFGPSGLEATGRTLAHAGLATTGAGRDLAGARSPVWLDTACGPVAVFAVTTALQGADAATATRPGVAGRAGINPLHASTALELDPATFRTMSAQAEALGGQPGEDGLRLFGTSLTRGSRTQAIVTLDGGDRAEILDAIRAARAKAVLVVLSIHGHDGDGREPPRGVVDFARAAVTAGAGLVIGHGPHRTGPIESYGGGLIAYGLGDFIADRRVAASLARNPFDAAWDGAPQGAVLTARFRGGRLQSSDLAALRFETRDGAAGYPAPWKAAPRAIAERASEPAG